MPKPDLRALRGASLDCAALANDTGAPLWDALRPGPVYDMDRPGVLHADLTPETIEIVQQSFQHCADLGIPVPFDWMHDGKGASYGVIESAEVGADGKWRVRPKLNALGKATLAEQGGALFLSPQFGKGPLCHPETGKVLAPLWVERAALTPTPRQNRLDAVSLGRGSDDAPVSLARFADSDEVRDFRRQLEAGAQLALSATDSWARWWSDAAEESGVVIITAYGPPEQASQLWMLDWSRAEGVVSVSNPRHAIEKTTYQEAAPAPVRVPLSRNKEAQMRNLNLIALLTAITAGVEGVTLSRGDDAPDVIVKVPDDVAQAFEDAEKAIAAERANAVEAAKTAGLELARVNGELRQAKALAEDADGLKGEVTKLSRKVKELEADKDEREKAAAKAEAKVYALSLSRDGYVPDTDEERAAIVANCEEFGLPAIKGMHAQQIASGVMTKRFKPTALGRAAAGIDGDPLPMPKVDDYDVQAEVKKLQEATPGLSDADAMTQLLSNHINGGVS